MFYISIPLFTYSWTVVLQREKFELIRLLRLKYAFRRYGMLSQSKPSINDTLHHLLPLFTSACLSATSTTILILMYSTQYPLFTFRQSLFIKNFKAPFKKIIRGRATSVIFYFRPAEEVLLPRTSGTLSSNPYTRHQVFVKHIYPPRIPRVPSPCGASRRFLRRGVVGVDSFSN